MADVGCALGAQVNRTTGEAVPTIEIDLPQGKITFTADRAFKDADTAGEFMRKLWEILRADPTEVIHYENNDPAALPENNSSES